MSARLVHRMERAFAYVDGGADEEYDAGYTLGERLVLELHHPHDIWTAAETASIGDYFREAIWHSSVETYPA